MKFNTLVLFAVVSLVATVIAVANAQESNPCDSKAELYLMNIGNEDSAIHDVIEVQAGYSVNQANNETVYRYANYRLEGNTQSVRVQLVLDSKTCLLKNMNISRDSDVQVDRRHDP